MADTADTHDTRGLDIEFTFCDELELHTCLIQMGTPQDISRHCNYIFCVYILKW